MRETFSKVTWGEVEPADVVLMPLDGLTEPVEAQVVGVERDDRQGLVYASIEAIGAKFPRWPFSPNTIAYVKARF